MLLPSLMVFFLQLSVYLCNYLLLLATDTTLQVVVVSRRAQGGICWSTCCVCYSVSSCVFVFLCVCVSICALICYHRPQTGGWEWDDGQTAGTRCRVSGNRHSSPPAAALIYALLSYMNIWYALIHIYAFLSYPIWIYDICTYTYTLYRVSHKKIYIAIWFW